ncbi:MAG: hypothetical protein C4586_08300 [Anaerolineaceae bacterium]|nr:MAG: hypothetical protein C4586_08300 [Anaerolineaceae bacterium]
MTTIAYRKDEKILAGDKLFDVGGTPVPGIKIHKIGALLCGWSGGFDNTQRFFDWIQEGRPNDKKPSMEKDQGFVGIIIENEEIYRYEMGLFPIKINKPFWAIGSGSDYALAAMEMGATAEQAIEIASRLDLYTGLGVDTVTAE